MPNRKASAVWEGGLKGGTGTFRAESGNISGNYSFSSRFEEGAGSNPEELLAAAHAACFSMAFANYLSNQGHRPLSISTKATISLENGVIGKMHLATEGQVPGMKLEAFKQYAAEAEKKCPVSNLLRNSLKITLDATLKD